MDIICSLYVYISKQRCTLWKAQGITQVLMGDRFWHRRTGEGLFTQNVALRTLSWKNIINPHNHEVTFAFVFSIEFDSCDWALAHWDGLRHIDRHTARYEHQISWRIRGIIAHYWTQGICIIFSHLFEHFTIVRLNVWIHYYRSIWY